MDGNEAVGRQNKSGKARAMNCAPLRLSKEPIVLQMD
jgi:hypothetical protein